MTPDLKERLRWIASAKFGDGFPDWMAGPSGNWGTPLSETAKVALELIEQHERVLKGYMRGVLDNEGVFLYTVDLSREDEVLWLKTCIELCKENGWLVDKTAESRLGWMTGTIPCPGHQRSPLHPKRECVFCFADLGEEKS